MYTESDELEIREGSFIEDHPMRRIRYNDDFTLDVLNRLGLLKGGDIDYNKTMESFETRED